MFSASSQSQKRKLEQRNEEQISPPPTKRKIQSTTNKNNVASFFTPASQKPPERTTWRTVSNSLLVAQYQPQDQPDADRRRQKRSKVAALDLDSTIVTSASGKKFARDATDWKWWHACVPGELRKLDQDGYQVVVFSNQGGISLAGDPKTARSDGKRLSAFKSRVSAILSDLDLPISVYGATAKDSFRKPRTGMWKEMLEDYDLEFGDGPDLEASFFVGDAGGRFKESSESKSDDFASSDRDFAANVKIDFKTPEEFFLNEKSRSFKRKFDPAAYLTSTDAALGKERSLFTKKHNMEIVLFCGSPGSGKSTFYWKSLAPLGYERVNQDILKTRDKCLKRASELLGDSLSVVVDNTNADQETRAHWIKLGKSLQVPVRCILFKAGAELCEHNDTVRALNGPVMNPESRQMLPKLAFTGFASRYQQPTVAEGLEDITAVDFAFDGTEEQREVWSKYWIS